MVRARRRSFVAAGAPLDDGQKRFGWQASVIVTINALVAWTAHRELLDILPAGNFMVHLSTPRLILRDWRDDDRAAFARMNADPRVMEFLARRLTREESDASVARIEEHIRVNGFGLYAAELCEERAFIGFIGIWRVEFEAAFTPCVEIGWRLAAEYWGRGLATEGARAVAAHAFTHVGLEEIVSFTVAANVRSRRVMEKIGMTRDAGSDFDHPHVAEGSPLRRHVLYRLRATEVAG